MEFPTFPSANQSPPVSLSLLNTVLAKHSSHTPYSRPKSNKSLLAKPSANASIFRPPTPLLRPPSPMPTNTYIFNCGCRQAYQGRTCNCFYNELMKINEPSSFTPETSQYVPFSYPTRPYNDPYRDCRRHDRYYQRFRECADHRAPQRSRRDIIYFEDRRYIEWDLSRRGYYYSDPYRRR